MLAEVGYEKTSFTAIADAVGIQRASVYHYFANKDDLLSAIGLPWLRPLAELVEQFDQEGLDPDLQLYRYLRIDLRHIKSAPYDLGRIFLLPGIPDSGVVAKMFDMVDTIHDAWLRWIAAAKTTGYLRDINPELAGSMVEAAYLGVIFSDRPSLAREIETTADNFADLVLAGLLADPGRLQELRELGRERDGVSPALNEILRP